MSISSPDPAEGHVVHLLQEWGDAVPPQDLRIGTGMRAASRVTLAVLLTVATAICAGGVFLLWTTETPGWWFSLLFTVMLVGLMVGLWGAYVVGIGSGQERARAQARWLESFSAARSLTGAIVARDVRTHEDGSVHSFDITVTVPSGVQVRGAWRPRTAGARPLLQPQVPGVGASARVWRVPGATADWPLVIEVVDPSVVTGGEARPPIAKYVD